MYGCETSIILKQLQKKMEATKMWLLQRMLRIFWAAKKSNETALRAAGTTKSLINRIHKHHATFFAM